ncbi:Redoxin-domain-containing protein [Hygrophoropsis aurantiaca]|uniref:Redoxin-domain-containing protein n=1 Tax=Hygrophoropsis aurantiaca TaxID=72124 RepID=A0ACB8ANQ8_9AGAM|nr:Redoxin-domain-containing protein [Hygrophoropsis aurantiaca]
MASLLSGAARAAHSAAAGLLSAAQITAGEPIPVKPVKEDDLQQTTVMDLTGKNIILGVPGAFTPSCSSQVPKYVEDYDRYKAKGVQNIYVVAVNDACVTKAWKAKLAPNGTAVRFISDDTGEFTSGLGMLFDATKVLGGPRSKRYAIITDGNRADFVAVEDDPGSVTSTSSSSILERV